MNKQRSFLKWPGNKFRCLDYLLPHCGPAQRWIEPFVGSGTVFLNALYPVYILAELNLDIINVFKYLQTEGIVFMKACQRLFSEENNHQAYYYAMRDKFNSMEHGRERAITFLYLNRHGYNGLCRYNSKGGYNVPFGTYIKPYFPRMEMEFFYQKSQQATFYHADFRSTFAMAREGDIIYCDPPYAPRVQSSNFSAYGIHRFGEREQIELVQLAEFAASQGATVIISNHDTPTTRDYYQNATLINSFRVKRSISCQVEQRVDVQELIAIYNHSP